MSTRPQRRPDPARVGLPTRAFLFTLDQVCVMLGMDEAPLRQQHIYFMGRHTGSRPAGKMIARNVAPDGERPDWRVAEQELVRWLKHKGFRIYERGWPTT